ncbi:hypothetical protein DIPPA_32281 [Diplonema papillatum]|nr:hypothetical protein DIPPA_32281 [Diplonema papillatum]|eukprot:gene21476-33039_t
MDGSAVRAIVGVISEEESTSVFTQPGEDTAKEIVLVQEDDEAPKAYTVSSTHWLAAADATASEALHHEVVSERLLNPVFSGVNASLVACCAHARQQPSPTAHPTFKIETFDLIARLCKDLSARAEKVKLLDPGTTVETACTLASIQPDGSLTDAVGTGLPVTVQEDPVRGYTLHGAQTWQPAGFKPPGGAAAKGEAVGEMFCAVVKCEGKVGRNDPLHRELDSSVIVTREAVVCVMFLREPAFESDLVMNALTTGVRKASKQYRLRAPTVEELLQTAHQASTLPNWIRGLLGGNARATFLVTLGNAKAPSTTAPVAAAVRLLALAETAAKLATYPVPVEDSSTARIRSLHSQLTHMQSLVSDCRSVSEVNAFRQLREQYDEAVAQMSSLNDANRSLSARIKALELEKNSWKQTTTLGKVIEVPGPSGHHHAASPAGPGHTLAKSRSLTSAAGHHGGMKKQSSAVIPPASLSAASPALHRPQSNPGMTRKPSANAAGPKRRDAPQQAQQAQHTPVRRGHSVGDASRAQNPEEVDGADRGKKMAATEARTKRAERELNAAVEELKVALGREKKRADHLDREHRSAQADLAALQSELRAVRKPEGKMTRKASKQPEPAAISTTVPDSQKTAAARAAPRKADGASDRKVAPRRASGEPKQQPQQPQLGLAHENEVLRAEIRALKLGGSVQEPAAVVQALGGALRRLSACAARVAGSAAACNQTMPQLDGSLLVADADPPAYPDEGAGGLSVGQLSARIEAVANDIAAAALRQVAASGEQQPIAAARSNQRSDSDDQLATALRQLEGLQLQPQASDGADSGSVEFHRLKAWADDLESQRDALNEAAHEAVLQIAEQEAQVDKLNQVVKDLEAQLKEAQEKEADADELKRLRSWADDLETEREALHEAAHEAVAQLAEQEAELEKANEAVKALEERLRTDAAQRGELEELRGAGQPAPGAELVALRSELAGKQAEADGLRAALAELESRLQDSEQKSGHLAVEKGELECRLSARANKSMHEIEKYLNTSAVGFKNQELEQLREEVNEKSDAVEELEEQLAALRAKHTDTDALEAAVKDMQTQLHDARLSASEARATASSQRRELDQLHTSAADHESTASRLAEKQSQLEAAEAALEQEKQTVRALNARLDESEQKTGHLAAEKGELETRLSARANKSMNEIEKYLTTSAVGFKNQEIDHMRGELEEKDETIDEMKEQADALQAQLSAAAATLAERDAQLAALHAEKTELETRLTCRAREGITDIERFLNNSVAFKNAELENLHSSIAGKEEELNLTQAALTSRSRELVDREGQLAALKREKDELESRLAHRSQKGIAEIEQYLNESAVGFKNKELERLHALVSEREEELAASRDVMARMQEQLEDRERESETARGEFRREFEEKTRELSLAEAALSELIGEKEDLQARLSQRAQQGMAEIEQFLNTSAVGFKNQELSEMHTLVDQREEELALCKAELACIREELHDRERDSETGRDEYKQLFEAKSRALQLAESAFKEVQSERDELMTRLSTRAQQGLEDIEKILNTSAVGAKNREIEEVRELVEQRERELAAYREEMERLGDRERSSETARDEYRRLLESKSRELAVAERQLAVVKGEKDELVTRLSSRAQQGVAEIEQFLNQSVVFKNIELDELREQINKKTQEVCGYQQALAASQREKEELAAILSGRSTSPGPALQAKASHSDALAAKEQLEAEVRRLKSEVRTLKDEVAVKTGSLAAHVEELSVIRSRSDEPREYDYFEESVHRMHSCIDPKHIGPSPSLTHSRQAALRAIAAQSNRRMQAIRFMKLMQFASASAAGKREMALIKRIAEEKAVRSQLTTVVEDLQQHVIRLDGERDRLEGLVSEL